MEPVTVIGSYLSPYVRKVLVCLAHKGIPYRIDPIVPFFGNAEFTRLSPLRRIPVLICDRMVLSDSTAICEYLDERWPQHPMYPQTPEQRARARWLEEFADTRLGDVFIWHFYAQLVVRKRVWREEPDAEVVRKAREEEIPAVLDYLEGELPPAGWLFSQFCVADAAIATFFRNAAFAGFAIDGERWPRTADFVTRALERPEFVALRGYEDLIMRTPIPQRDAALRAAGAPLTATTLGTDTPQRGVMPI
jgi:glutathione S-transferase